MTLTEKPPESADITEETRNYGFVVLIAGIVFFVVGFLVIAVSTLGMLPTAGDTYIIVGGAMFAIGVALFVWSWKMLS